MLGHYVSLPFCYLAGKHDGVISVHHYLAYRLVDIMGSNIILHVITIKTTQYTALLFSVGVGFNRNIKPRHGLKTEQIFGRDFIFCNEFSNKIKHKFG